MLKKEAAKQKDLRASLEERKDLVGPRTEIMFGE